MNPRKTWLIVKEEAYNLAVQLFSGTGVQITSKSKRHLGAALGNSFVEEYVGAKVKEW